MILLIALLHYISVLSLPYSMKAPADFLAMPVASSNYINRAGLEDLWMESSVCQCVDNRE